MKFDWQETPCFIINRNNLDRGFRQQLNWLNAAGMQNVTVIDNQSTYPPLLEFYSRNNDFKLLAQTENFGPWVFWNKLMYRDVPTKYIVSDADVVPAECCPKDLVRKMHEIFHRYSPRCAKVGPGIRIDNLPSCYEKRDKVIAHELQFSLEAHRCAPGDVFDALIDTTFAMYVPGVPFPDWCQHFRLAAPYVIEHFPWYEDSSTPTEEHLFYTQNSQNGWATWEGR